MILYALVVPLGIFLGECGYRYSLASDAAYCERDEAWGIAASVVFILVQATVITVAIATEQPPFVSLP